MTADPARRAAVLGSPIGHSLSPVLHRAAYEHLGLVGWTYEAYDVAEPGLAGFLAGLDASWAGLSLTMPLKAAVLPLLDGASPMVETVGAANTVLLRDGRRVGENTDVPGMVAALAAHGVGPRRPGRRARRGSDRPVRAGRAVDAHRLGPGLRARPGPARGPAVGRRGRRGRPADRAVGPGGRRARRAAGGQHHPGRRDRRAGRAGAARRSGTLFEVLYDPWPTPLAAAWQARRAPVVDGLDLLVHQAVLQVALMTGRRGGSGRPGAGAAGCRRTGPAAA